MPRKTIKKAETAEVKKERNKTAPQAPRKAKNPGTSKAKKPVAKKEDNVPDLRSVYSNNKHILFPLGFATDFKTNKPVVIFSNLATGEVHTIALSIWNRWKLKEVKKLNTEV